MMPITLDSELVSPFSAPLMLIFSNHTVECQCNVTKHPMRAALLFGCLVLAVSGRTTWDKLDASYTFDQYREEFGRTYEVGSPEYAVRQAEFQSNLARVLRHNADPTKTWKVSVSVV
jgi:hypothetical protein